MKVNQIDLSIIIVHYNTPRDLDICLKSIYDFTKEISFEIFVVDNKSPNRDIDRVVEKYPKVTYKPLEKNYGFPAGNNVILKEITGEFVLFLNPDTYIVDDALSNLILFMRQSGAAICAPRLISEIDKLHYDGGKFPTISSFLYSSFQLDTRFPQSMFGKHFYGTWNRMNTQEIDWVPGAALMINQSVLRTIGGFDENIFMFAEDIDLCWRAKKLGYKVYVYGSSKIIHHYGKATIQNIPQRIAASHASKLYIIKKHKSKIYFYVYYMIMFFTVFIKLLILCISVIFLKNNYIKIRCHGYVWCFNYLLSSPKTAILDELMSVKPRTIL